MCPRFAEAVRVLQRTSTSSAFLPFYWVRLFMTWADASAFPPGDQLVCGASKQHFRGHDGRTNSFHVNVCDDIALTYNAAW